MNQLKNMMSVSKILQGARDIVANRWGKGYYVTGPDGTDKTDFNMTFGIPDDDDGLDLYCSDGALRRAAKNLIRQSRENISKSKGDTLLERSQEALCRAIDRKGQCVLSGTPPANNIWLFNDHPMFTKKDILEVFDDAIAEQCRQVEQLSCEWRVDHVREKEVGVGQGRPDDQTVKPDQPDPSEPGT